MRAADENVVALVLEELAHHLVLIRRDAAYYVDDERVVLERMRSLLRVHQVAELERLGEEVL